MTSLISIIVPCRNEVAFIDVFLRSLVGHEGLAIDDEILISDGMSDDGTRERLNAWMDRDPRIRMIDNPERIVSTGLNRAVRAARGEIIVRMDVHTEYDPDYVRQCVCILEETGADNVGGPWVAAGRSPVQQAIALAFHSPFSCGGARGHNAAYEGSVDTVYLGCWRRGTLERIGLFDEELVRNQDDELNLRLSRCGGKIWQSPRIRSRYFPRPCIRALFRQYVQYGYWKVRVIQKHRLPASVRHLVPGGFVGTLFALLLLSPFSASAAWMGAILLLLYAAAALIASWAASRKGGHFRFLPMLPFIFGAFHFGYGWGFLRGCIDFLLLGRQGRKQFSQVTR
jgi:succinoglycan biosynthesis protein ExoA